MSDERASVDDLLGIDPGWCGDQTVDEYMAQARGERYAPDPSLDTPDDPEGAEEVAVARDRARQAAEVHGGAGWTRMSDPSARTES